MPKTAVLLVAHGSRLPATSDAFARLAAQVGARTPGTTVAPAYLGQAAPTIPDAAAALVADGATAIVLLPYFLHEGAHIREDLPALIDRLRTAHPDVTFTLQPPLVNEALVEDLLVERIDTITQDPATLPETGDAIEAQSHAIIDRRLERESLDPATHAVLRRIIHATADFSYVQSLQIHPEAVQADRNALAAGAPVICDSTILQAGITRTAATALCAIRDEDVTAAARAKATTRATAAMDKLAPHMNGAVVAIGNAPTALWRVLALAREQGAAPALIVALPVGFVGARESKDALRASGLRYITNTTARGGSPAAAAAVNALALLAKTDA